MFETFLQMQIIHQKPFNKVVSLDGHLHYWSPLHSTHSQTTRRRLTTVRESKVLQTLARVLMFTVIPYWTFYVYHYVMHDIYVFKMHTLQTHFKEIY